MPGMAKFRIGLALGSGAARGWAHIGVLRAFSELGIAPDIVCGTSIGALVGGFHLAGHLNVLEDWARRLTKLKMFRYLDFRLSSKGLIAGNRLFAEMETYLADTKIEDLPLPFASVATELDTGHEVWLTEGSLVDAVRASFSLPAFFEPTIADGRWLVDGALVNPVPVSVCRALGARVVIAINLNGGGRAKKREPQNAAFAPSDLEPPARGSVMALKGPRRRFDPRGFPFGHHSPDAPSLLGVIAATLNIVQDRVTRSRLAADPPDIIIAPRIEQVGLLDFHLASDLIDAGEAAVHEATAQIHDALPALDAATQ
ncbi:MAG: patatin-like phospholipase family protein [Alphaproteobacteria bacterium]